MKDDYISTLRRNARLARECKEQAEEAKALAGGHCRDEAELYLKASDYYRKNVEISTGEERAYNEELMNEYVAMARKIAGILKAKMELEAGNTAASGSTPVKKCQNRSHKYGKGRKYSKSSKKQRKDENRYGSLVPSQPEARL